MVSPLPVVSPPWGDGETETVRLVALVSVPSETCVLGPVRLILVSGCFVQNVNILMLRLAITQLGKPRIIILYYSPVTAILPTLHALAALIDRG